MYASSMAGGEWSRAIAVAAFVASYVGLGLGRVPPFRVDRTGVAIIGAAAMVASGALPWPDAVAAVDAPTRSEEHTSELQSRLHLVCRLLLEKKKIFEPPDHRRQLA